MRSRSRYTRGSSRILAPLLVCALAAACSETHQPLDWREAVRGGTEGLDTLATAALVVETGSAGARATTGLSTYLLAGRLDRLGSPIEVRAFLQWDVSGLPEGTVEDAHLEMHLRDVQPSGLPQATEYPLELRRVTSAWSEDSLALGTPPEVEGAALATAEVDTANVGVTDGVALKRLFDEPDDERFVDLVRAWESGSTPNHGVAVVPAPGAPPGIPRFWSAEGLPSSVTAPFNSPLLVVSLTDGSADTTVSIEPTEDAFVAGLADGGGLALPDSLLLVSAGYVQRTALRFDPAPLLAQAQVDSLSGLLVVKGVLHLALVAGMDGSLPEGETLPLLAYAADSLDWGALDSIPAASLVERVALVTLTGGEASVEIPIASFLQRMVEGGPRNLVLLANTEILEAGSALFKGSAAQAGAPRVEVIFARTSGRLDP